MESAGVAGEGARPARRKRTGSVENGGSGAFGTNRRYVSVGGNAGPVGGCILAGIARTHPGANTRTRAREPGVLAKPDRAGVAVASAQGGGRLVCGAGGSSDSQRRRLGTFSARRR